MSAHSHRSRLGRFHLPVMAAGRVALAVLFGVGAWQVHAAPLTLDLALPLAQERSRQLPAQDDNALASA